MARSLFAFIPLILTAGAFVLLLFVVLGGVAGTTPFNSTFFLAVDRAGSSDRWTLWQTCTAAADGTLVCPHASPAHPFNISSYLGSAKAGDNVNLVNDALNNSSFYYYTTRFEFAFFLIALTFTAITLLTALLALCSRLGGAISAVCCSIALLFAIIAAALMTAWTVTARNALNSAGVPASLGVKAYGFAWGGVGALLLSFFLFCGVCCASRRSRKNKGGDYVDGGAGAGTAGTGTGTVTTTGNRRFWQRKEKVPYDAEHAANGSY